MILTHIAAFLAGGVAGAVLLALLIANGRDD